MQKINISLSQAIVCAVDGVATPLGPWVLIWNWIGGACQPGYPRPGPRSMPRPRHRTKLFLRFWVLKRKLFWKVFAKRFAENAFLVTCIRQGRSVPWGWEVLTPPLGENLGMIPPPLGFKNEIFIEGFNFKNQFFGRLRRQKCQMYF